MINILSVDKVLKSLAYSKKVRFNARQVAFLAKTDEVDEIYTYLISREGYILNRSFEVLCPKRQDSAAAYDSLEMIPKGWIECRICGEEFVANLDEIHVVFNFTKEYIEFVRTEIEDEKKMKHSLVSI